MREVRLEYHDNATNSHKYYTIRLEKYNDDLMRVWCCWGRCRGWFGSRYSAGSAVAQTKEVTENAINALVTFQKWVAEKEAKGYKPVVLQEAR